MQLLIFTGLAFWFLMRKLHAGADITLDTDWFYRRPSRLAYNVFSISICRLFGAVEKLSLRLVQFAVRLGNNPLGYLVDTTRSARYFFFRTKKPVPEPLTFSPDRYRVPLGVMVLVVLLCLIVLLAWDILI
jgi:hypothetical protein